MDTAAKSKWQVRLAALMIFVIGFIAGALALNIYHGQRRSSDSPRMMRQRLGQIVDRLNLSPEQETQVKDILDDARERLTEIRKESEPRFREVRKQTDERLQAVLTPEQWEQFREMTKEGRQRRRSGGGRDGEMNKP
jgi:Spy/CpxP family protein refolding chaperone